MPKPTLFVSHSHYDNDWCRAFVASLQRLGYDVWYDEKGLSGGAQWVATIEREVEARDVLALVLTPEARASQWVNSELQLAYATHRRIVPILLKETEITGFLRTYQAINVAGMGAEDAASKFDTSLLPGIAPPSSVPADVEGGEVVAQHVEQDQQIALDKQREDLLQVYLDRMSELLLHDGLRQSKPGDEVRNVARVRTTTILNQLDARRVGKVFAFLRDAGLMSEKPDSSVVSLSEADFRHVNWGAAILTGANLSGANLSGATLDGADLSSANLSGANLTGAILDGANLSGATLSGATLSEARLAKANLFGATLREADLAKANLSGAILTEATLSGAILKEATLSGATLFEADLRADFSNADLRRAAFYDHARYERDLLDVSGLSMWEPDLTGANLSGATLDGADLSSACLEKANLSGATLIGATLRGAHLSEATLSKANLSAAHLNGASLYKADLNGANLSWADFSEANLYGANLYGAQFDTVGEREELEKKAASLTGATMPDGSQHP